MPERDRDDDSTAPLIITRSGSGGKGGHGKLLDPHAAMPGAVKRVGGDNRDGDDPIAADLGNKAELRRKYFEFVHRLADRNYADPSDPVPALAATFGISNEQAMLRQSELHDALTNSTRSQVFGDTLRKTNTDVHARTARLSDFMYSPDPKISLVAIKILNDMDEGSTSAAEETIEDHIAALLDE